MVNGGGDDENKGGRVKRVKMREKQSAMVSGDDGT